MSHPPTQPFCWRVGHCITDFRRPVSRPPQLSGDAHGGSRRSSLDGRSNSDCVTGDPASFNREDRRPTPPELRVAKAPAARYRAPNRPWLKTRLACSEFDALRDLAAIRRVVPLLSALASSPSSTMRTTSPTVPLLDGSESRRARPRCATSTDPSPDPVPGGTPLPPGMRPRWL